RPVKTDSTPVEWLVYRQYGVHALIWTIGVLALACNAWVPVGREAQGARNGPFFLAVASPLGTISGLMGGATVAWVGSRFFVGLRARTQAGAIVWAVGLAKGLPSLLELLCSVLSLGVRSPMGVTAEGYFIIWWIPELTTAVFYLWLIALAKSSLVKDLVGRERP